MPIWRLQCSWQLDTVAPRDGVMITPHFNDIGATTDPQNLCNDMLTGLAAIFPTTGEIRVKAYDAQGSKPVYPQGDAIVRKGQAHATNNPRELAVALSFYGERNVKRQRGRVFIPAYLLGANVSSLRPTGPYTKLNDLVGLFTGLGGADVDWCVYSRLMNHAYSVTNWWYDDEWDVMRSRGLRPTTRIQGTTNEASGFDITEAPLA